MSSSDYRLLLRILAINPPLFAVLGGIALILGGTLVDESLIISSGWSSLVTGAFLQVGWWFRRYYKAKYT